MRILKKHPSLPAFFTGRIFNDDHAVFIICHMSCDRENRRIDIFSLVPALGIRNADMPPFSARFSARHFLFCQFLRIRRRFPRQAFSHNLPGYNFLRAQINRDHVIFLYDPFRRLVIFARYRNRSFISGKNKGADIPVPKRVRAMIQQIRFAQRLDVRQAHPGTFLNIFSVRRMRVPVPLPLLRLCLPNRILNKLRIRKRLLAPAREIRKRDANASLNSSLMQRAHPVLRGLRRLPGSQALRSRYFFRSALTFMNARISS